MRIQVARCALAVTVGALLLLSGTVVPSAADSSFDFWGDDDSGQIDGEVNVPEIERPIVDDGDDGDGDGGGEDVPPADSDGDGYPDWVEDYCDGWGNDLDAGDKCAVPTEPDEPGAPRVTPDEAYRQVKASLKFEAPAPGVGPDHSVNHLTDEVTGKAVDSVVGYPTWFWGIGGSQDEKVVTKKVGRLRVTLSITPNDLTVKAGDGQPVTCTGAGTPWTKSVGAGARSPSGCDHVYENVGDYEVTATMNWLISYDITDGEGNAISGEDTVSASKSRSIAIGEMQSVIER